MSVYAPEYHYRFTPEHIPWMLEQVWEAREDMGVYDRLSQHEHLQVGPYLSHPSVVMDLGCGLGRVSVYLNAVWKDSSIHYILADTTGTTENKGRWNHPEGEVYNDLFLTQTFVRLNGLNNFCTFDLFQDDWSSLPKSDLITSHCAVGMHFPIEKVMSRLLQVSTPDVTMVFGTRQGKYHSHSFEELFREVYFLQPPETPPFPWQSWVILRGKRYA